MSGKRVVIVFGGLFVLALAVLLGARLYLPRLVDAKRRANEQACQEQLRRIGAAARQYAQDQGAFPHLSGAAQLDGGLDTPDTPQAFQALVKGGYLDELGLLTCPSAPRRRAPEDRARWEAWLRGESALEAPPFVATKLLSYGWTRRYLTLNASGRTPLAADRAAIPRRGEGGLMGNHTDGWSLLRLDGSVEFLRWDAEPFPGSYLSATEDPVRDGFLCVRPQLDAGVFNPIPPDGEGERHPSTVRMPR